MPVSGLKQMPQMLREHYLSLQGVSRMEMGILNLCAGKPSQLQEGYVGQKDEICNCLKVPSLPNETSLLLKKIQAELMEDKGFVETGLLSSLTAYKKRFDKEGSSHGKLKELNSDVVEFSKLLEQCQNFHNLIQNLLIYLNPVTYCFK